MTFHPVTILPSGRVAEAAEGALLSDVLRQAGLPISLYCRGQGLCGKCLVRVERGEPAGPEEGEASVLKRRGAGPGERLACRCRVSRPLAVSVPESSLLTAVSALAEGTSRSVAIDPPLKKIALRMPPVVLSDPESLGDRLSKILGRKAGRVSPSALRRLAGLDPASPAGVTAVLHGDDILDVEAADTSAVQYGAAVDLGTTTVVVEVLDLTSGRSRGAASALNRQVRFGADVVSRITAAASDPALLASLRADAVDTVNALLAEILSRSAIRAESVYEAVVAGNTAMSHFFLGIPVDSLAVSPFHAVFSAPASLSASEAGIGINPRGRISLAPNIRSFVGGDISAGLVAADIAGRPETSLYIDLGTNGEIVLKKGDSLWATSTAAGPAFEGMSISCGMIAAPGAVQQVEDDGCLRMHTIGGIPPRGICGSGLIDFLAIALERGWLAASGTIRNEAKTLVLAPSLHLTQRDVREVQTAAAAIKTGWKMLLAEAGCDAGDLQRIVIAGAFGNTLHIGNAVRLGLIPRSPEGRIEFAGNASLAGARILLLNSEERDACERIAARVKHVSLAQGEDFQKTFVEAMAFKPWS